MSRAHTASLASLVLSTLALFGCADTGADEAEAPAEQPAAQEPAAQAPSSLTVQVEPTEGNEARGTVVFTEEGGGIRVVAEFTGLSEGDHGFHIHETGDCSAPDGTSAGGHFAPEGSRHGGPDQQPPDAHVGDMGNMSADASGTASYDRVFADMAFQGDRGIAGRAVIVHGGPDDMTSQPSGAAGPRVACGVIPTEG